MLRLFLYFTIVLLISSCSQNYEEEFNVTKNENSKIQKRVYEKNRIYFCVSYDKSIINYDQFIMFMSITLSNPNNPERKYKYRIPYNKQTHCSSVIMWRDFIYYDIPAEDNIIENQYWNAEIEVAANHFVYTQDFEVSLSEEYIYEDEDYAELGTWICTDTYAGPTHTFKTTIDCWYMDQTEYFLLLKVKPYTINN